MITDTANWLEIAWTLGCLVGLLSYWRLYGIRKAMLDAAEELANGNGSRVRKIRLARSRRRTAFWLLIAMAGYVLIGVAAMFSPSPNNEPTWASLAGAVVFLTTTAGFIYSGRRELNEVLANIREIEAEQALEEQV